MRLSKSTIISYSLKNDIQGINTRYRNKLYVPQINTFLARDINRYQSIYIFNKLPKLIQEKESLAKL